MTRVQREALRRMQALTYRRLQASLWYNFPFLCLMEKSERRCMPICLQILAAVCPALWSYLDTSHMHARYYDFLSSPHVVFMIIFCFSLQKILPVFLILMDSIFGMLFLSELLLFTNSHSMKWTILWQSNTGGKKKKKSHSKDKFLMFSLSQIFLQRMSGSPSSETAGFIFVGQFTKGYLIVLSLCVALTLISQEGAFFFSEQLIQRQSLFQWSVSPVNFCGNCM